MNGSTMADRMLELFESGFNCAEAMVRAASERLGSSDGAARAATALGGGGGRTKGGECGIYTGGLLVLGLAHGRKEAGANWDYLADLCAAWREGFEVLEGTTSCRELMARYQGQEDMRLCKNLAWKAAAVLEELLEDSVAENRKEFACA